MQLSASGDLVPVRAVGLGHLQRHVAVEFLEKSLPNHARGEELSLPSREGTLVDAQGHANGGLLHGDGGKGGRGLDSSLVGDEGVADLDLVETGKHDNLAGFGHFDLLLTEVVEDEETGETAGAVGLVGVDELHRLSVFDGAGGYSADAQLSFEIVVVDVGHEGLKHRGLERGDLRGIDGVHDGFEEGRHVIGEVVGVGTGPALNSGGVDDREVGLFVAGVKFYEKIEDLVDDVVGTGSRTVDFVHHHEDLVAFLQRLVQNEAGLGLGALDRVHYEEDAVAHVQNAFHLSSKVSVAWGIHDIDLRVAPHHREILC
mmetsp:Transcript_12334/g.27001  ORF Transcript_12334/g.27001 Transcript_12334/m.27001 type:complete len:315 (+) Transcript_12334:784-1728(+)